MVRPMNDDAKILAYYQAFDDYKTKYPTATGKEPQAILEKFGKALNDVCYSNQRALYITKPVSVGYVIKFRQNQFYDNPAAVRVYVPDTVADREAMRYKLRINDITVLNEYPEAAEAAPVV